MGSVRHLYGKHPSGQGTDDVPYLYEKNRPQSPLVKLVAMNPDSVLLQFGSGDGNLTMDLGLELERLGGRGVVFAEEFASCLTEPLDDRVAEARLDQRIRVVPLSSTKTQTFALEDGSVDRFIAVNVLQYLSLESQYWQELRRVLARHAKVLIADWKTWVTRSTTTFTDDFYWAKTKICLHGLGFKVKTLGDLPGFEWVILAE